MKKIIKLFLMISIVFLLIGCGKKEEVKKEPPLADDEVILENIKYKLDQDETGYGIKYKIASNFRKTVLTNAINYFSEKIDNQSYFVIRIFHYKNKDIKYAIKDSTNNKYEKKWNTKINDLDYTVVRLKNPIGDEVYTNLYYHRYKKDTYTFLFTSNIDLSRLENILLKQINI